MFAEDLDVFFADMALDATYDGATAVKVLFDAAYLEQLDGVANVGPAATGKASDFPAASAIGKTLVIGATTYRIRTHEPQDDGAIVILRLEKT